MFDEENINGSKITSAAIIKHCRSELRRQCLILKLGKFFQNAAAKALPGQTVLIIKREKNTRYNFFRGFVARKLRVDLIFILLAVADGNFVDCNTVKILKTGEYYIHDVHGEASLTIFLRREIQEILHTTYRASFRQHDIV